MTYSTDLPYISDSLLLYLTFLEVKYHEEATCCVRDQWRLQLNGFKNTDIPKGQNAYVMSSK
jgi:hypothetical protein